MAEASNTPAAPDTNLQITDHDAIAATASGSAVQVVWLSKGTKIRPDDLRTVLRNAGQDDSKVPDIDPVKALTKVVKNFSVVEKGKKTMEAVVAETTDTEVVVNILELTKQRYREMARVTIDTLIWDRTMDCWLNSGATEHAAKLRDAVADKQMYHDGNLVRELLVMPALRDSNVVTIARKLYIVPTATAEPLAKAQQAIAGIDNFHMWAIRVNVASGEWAEPLQMATEDGMRGELDELNKQIDGWKDMAQRVRTDTVRTVMERFDSLRLRAELYAESLQVTLDDLNDDIDEMLEMAKEVIDGKDAEANAKAGTRPAPTPTTPEDALRMTLANMAVPQLKVLWAAHGLTSEPPEDLAEMIETIVCAVHAAEQYNDDEADEAEADEPAAA